MTNEGGSKDQPRRLPSSLTHVHRCIGYHTPTWQSLSKSVRLTYPSVYDNRDTVSDPTLLSPPPSSRTDVHIIQNPTLPTPTLLTFTCSQVFWFLSRLTKSRVSSVTTRPVTSLTIISTCPLNPVCVRSLDPSVLVFSLSLYRYHLYIFYLDVILPRIIQSKIHKKKMSLVDEGETKNDTHTDIYVWNVVGEAR